MGAIDKYFYCVFRDLIVQTSDNTKTVYRLAREIRKIQSKNSSLAFLTVCTAAIATYSYLRIKEQDCKIDALYRRLNDIDDAG